MFTVRIFSDKGIEILARKGVKDYDRPNFLEGDVTNALFLVFESGTEDVIFFGDNFLVLVEELPEKK